MDENYRKARLKANKFDKEIKKDAFGQSIVSICSETCWLFGSLSVWR